MHRTPQTNRVADTSSSSPPVQESPFSSFLSNLTPINTVKCESYTQLGNFLPTPPIVFATPHVDPHREKTFFERNDMGDAGSNADVYRECNMNIIDNSSFEKDGQLRDVSGCVDDYLADPARGDSTDSARLHVNPANEVPQLSLRGSTVSKQLNTQVLDVTSDSTKKESLESSNPAGNNLRSIQHIESKMNKTSDKGSGAYHSFSSVSGEEESVISVDFVSRAQNHGQDPTNLQTAGYQYGEQNLIVQSHDDLHERKRKVSRGSLQDENRGIRRHLQFETAIAHKSTTFGNNESLCSMSHDTTNLRSPPSNLTDLKNLYSSHVDNKASSDPTAVSCETLQLSSYPHGSVRSGQPGGNSSTSALVCSSIGLHLNSITRSTSMNSDVYSSRKSTGYVITTDQMLDHVNRNNIKDDSVSTFISAIPGKSYTCVGNGERENHSLFTLYPSDGMPYLPSGSMHQMLVDQQLVPCEVGDASQDAKKVEELNQLSETKRERRGAEISDSCKRCNCKKSKCLKLYCECFAAGVFCLDSCACENCYNKPEFEDTVFDTRQQIESRNPLAFAPKVVKYEVDSSPNNMEQAHWTTPSSARHKRGCNCKKSKCLKKYCECFQANVGCSEACRCDCCQNPCGTKADHEYNHAEKWETQSSEKLDTTKGGNDCIKATIRNPYSPCWDELSAISNATPISQTGLSTKVSSVSSSLRICTKVSKSQRQSSRLQSSGTRLTKRDCSPITFTAVYESKGPYQLSSDGASHERMDDDTPEILEEDSISPLVVMAGSPNQKRVSPPQSRAERLRSSSHTGLRSGRKFTLKAVPSFPNLSPE